MLYIYIQRTFITANRGGVASSQIAFNLKRHVHHIYDVCSRDTI